MVRRYVAAIAIIVAASFGLGAWASAQVFLVEPVDPPIVMSGAEVGFQIEGRQGDDILGRVVVRIDGEWVPVVQSARSVRRAGSN